MNCDQFIATVQDLVHCEPDFVGTTAAAVAHSLDCERCAARLAAEQALQARLRLLAASQESAGASPIVETILLEAFRQRARNGKGMTRPYTLGKFARTRIALVALSIAAMLLLIVVVSRLTKRSPHGGRVEIAGASGPAPAGRDNTAEGDATLKHAVHYPGERESAPVEMSRGIYHRRQRLMPAGSSSNSVRLTSAGPLTAAAGGDDGGEIVTEFMPVGYGSNLIPMDGAQMLRIKLPRSAMLSYGLPVNPDRVDEPISADLVVGNDGVARAIRFVHEQTKHSK
jgi:hypothetical protein